MHGLEASGNGHARVQNGSILVSSDRLTVRRHTQMPMSRCLTAARYRSRDILSDSREHERRHGGDPHSATLGTVLLRLPCP